MSDSYRRNARPISETVDRRILQRSTVWDRIVSIVTDADLLAVATICVIGLLLSLAVMLAVPGFGEMTEAVQQLL